MKITVEKCKCTNPFFPIVKIDGLRYRIILDNFKDFYDIYTVINQFTENMVKFEILKVPNVDDGRCMKIKRKISNRKYIYYLLVLHKYLKVNNKYINKSNIEVYTFYKNPDNNTVLTLVKNRDNNKV